MRFSWPAAAVMLLFSGLAQADQQSGNPAEKPGENELAVGVGLICNTSEQVQRYVSLRSDGAETAGALEAVNQEAQDPRACGVAAIAFMADKTVDTKNMHGKLVSIVRINVVAAFDGQRWALVPTMTQYAVMEVEGYEI